jgi:hypothetical protein
MTRKQETICGIEIPPEERTPLVERLLEKLAELQAEVERLGKLVGPQPGQRPVRQPSSLHQPEPPKQAVTRPRRRRRRGWRKRAKTRTLVVHETVPVEIPDPPAGARKIAYKDYFVQELVHRVHTIRYRRYRYEFPDGSRPAAELPADVRRHRHFGPTLRAYLLSQHYQNGVTQPLLAEELRDLGFCISAGQVNRLLSEGHAVFHAEKDALLPAAREISEYFQVDDTPARHQGRNGHTHCLCNEFFTSFTTTDTKSRLNFLELIREPFQDYVLGEAAWEYLEFYGFPQRRLAALRQQIGEALVVEGAPAWEQHLAAWKITGDEPRRLLTEAAVWGSLLEHGLYEDQPWLSDDAQQFKLAGFAHALCWVHAERHVAQLLPGDERQRNAQERARTDIWHYYQRLKAYREQPTSQKQARLSRDFDRLFQRRTGWPELNDVLQRLHSKKDELLLVLEHPALPLHNNRNEGDIREYAKKRKISAGTRSALGRRCRDTFLSLKKTCRKLGQSFWSYLQDRIRGVNQILPLPELMHRAAANAK